jgi:DME family drug/metabolite transporter
MKACGHRIESTCHVLHQQGVAWMVSARSPLAAILEWMSERHRLSVRWLVCTAIAVVGIVFLASGEHREIATNGSALLGVGLGLIAGLAYALYTYESGRADCTGRAPRVVMRGIFGFGAMLLLPVLVVFAGPLLQSGRTIGIATYLAIAPMFVA